MALDEVCAKATSDSRTSTAETIEHGKPVFIRKMHDTYNVKPEGTLSVEIGNDCPRDLNIFACNFNITPLPCISRIDCMYGSALVQRYYPQASRLFSVYTCDPSNLHLPDLPLDPYRQVKLVITLKKSSSSEPSAQAHLIQLQLSYDIFRHAREVYPLYAIDCSGTRDITSTVNLYPTGKIMGFYVRHGLDEDHLSKFIKTVTLRFAIDKEKYIIIIGNETLRSFERSFGNGIIPLLRKSRDPSYHTTALNGGMLDNMSIEFEYADHVKPRELRTNNVHIYTLCRCRPATICETEVGGKYWHFG